VKDVLCDGFQAAVNDHLVRHRSILDVMSKLVESSSRANRAVSKSVTACGCISVNAEKQTYPQHLDSLHSLREHVKTHVDGTLCENCRDVIEDEIGRTLFYLAALCNALDLSLYDILIKEQDRISCLGVFSVQD
jgi:hypothetical protein